MIKMDLTNLLIDAGVGFTQGLLIGANDNIGRKEDALEIAALTYSGRKDMNLEDPGALSTLRRTINFMKVAPSICVATVYSAVAGLSSGGGLGRVYAAVPAAILGRYAGHGWSYLKHRKERRDNARVIATLKSGKGVESLLSAEQAVKLNGLMETLEDDLAQAKEPEKVIGDFCGEIGKAFKGYEGQPYFKLMTSWVDQKVETAIRRGKVQKEVREFFDERLPVRGAIGAALIGEPKEPRARVYSREGSMMNVEDAEWRGVDTKHVPGKGLAILAPRVSLSTVAMYEFERNYKELAREIDSVPGSVILLNSGLEIFPNKKDHMLSNVFLPHYGVFFMNQKKENEKNGK